MKVLHITSWYPSKQSPLDGIFIREHIDALSQNGVENKVYHINISNNPFRFSFKRSLDYSTMVLHLPVLKWFVVEILVTVMIAAILIKNFKKYDILNFHIAYPNLTYWKYLRYLTKAPVICNEHWSAYGQNFGLPISKKSSKKLKKVKAIFKQKILFLFVSDHLSKQILDFTNNTLNEYKVLPNVVNDVFRYRKTESGENITFFAASVWRKGKRPMEMIRGFQLFSQKHPNCELIIAGVGEFIPDMLACVAEWHIGNISIVGEKTKTEIANYLNNSSALCHSSEHETFSVICAEALVSGCPVIVNKLPAVLEFTDNSNSILVSDIAQESWRDAFNQFYANRNNFNREKIAKKAHAMFSKEFVGTQYKVTVNNICEKYSKENISPN